LTVLPSNAEIIAANKPCPDMEKKLVTHYSNLKVEESAPAVVIRASYRALAQQYHPDKNPGDTRAAEVMRILNDAHDTLTDPTKREAYDAHLQNLRTAPSTRAASHGQPSNSQSKYTSKAIPPRKRSLLVRALFYDIRLSLGILVLAVIGIAELTSGNSTAPRRSARQSSSYARDDASPMDGFFPPRATAEAPSRGSLNAYTRPLTAPNGVQWPSFASYVREYPILRSGGLSQVTVDNTQNNSDVFVKLVDTSTKNPFEIRCFFIPSGGKFTCENVLAGPYDIRYRELDSGALAKTEEFQLEEVRTTGGTNYSMLSVTLYKVMNGNMRTKSISEAEF
jgi:curved DNA-binding protein CbpA